MPSHPKRPRDPAQLAKMIVDIATGEIENKPDTGLTKRAGWGKRGGVARSLAPLTRRGRAATNLSRVAA